MMRVLSIGEILWDVFPDKELLGGAPLNFSANSARLGNAVTLITAVGNDERGRRALEATKTLGVNTDFFQVVSGRPTGTALVSTTPEGEPCFKIPRPAAFDFVDVSSEALASAQLLKPDWLYFGTLLQMKAHVEQITHVLAESLPGIRRFYDMNLRTGSWNFPLVQRLCKIASVLKLNEHEAQILGPYIGMGAAVFSLEEFCARWASLYELKSICVTLGAAGCLVYENGVSQTVPGFATEVQDTVGAGDAFAAAFLQGYHQEWPLPRTARFANALGSIVASRPGATPEWSMEECLQIASISLEKDSLGNSGL